MEFSEEDESLSSPKYLILPGPSNLVCLFIGALLWTRKIGLSKSSAVGVVLKQKQANSKILSHSGSVLDKYLLNIL